MITVLFFGPLTEIAGNNSLQMPDVSDTESLEKNLFAKFPALAAHSYALAVGRTIVHQNTLLKPGSEVALLPPFSGG